MATEKITEEINEYLNILSDVEENKKTLHDEQSAIRLTKQALQAIYDADDVIRAGIIAAAEANPGDYNGEAALSVAIQARLDAVDTTYDITDLADNVEEFDRLWTQTAEAQRVLESASVELRDEIKNSKSPATSTDLVTLLERISRGCAVIVKGFSDIRATDVSDKNN